MLVCLETSIELVFVTVTALGPELDYLRKEEQKKGRTLRSYSLDNAEVLALHALGKSLNNLAQEQADMRGWSVGYRMSPGSRAGWSIKDQTALCNLLPLEKIGLRLTDSAMLTPLKSVAGMIGMGPGFHIISKDAGFDPLIKHLRTKKISVQRKNDLTEIPILPISDATTIDKKISAIIKNLVGRGQSKPRKVQTLSNTISSLFTQKLEEDELENLLNVMKTRQYIVEKEGNISYELPQ